jgi:GNAT superfamily N-acetyltransferase
MTIRVEPLTGAALVRALPELARLRIAVFRDWPYLYDGTLDYEQNYLDRFGRAQNALIVAAFDADTLVGIATASPMTGHADKFIPLFAARGLDSDRIFYFGESVLLKEYRGRGIGHAFFDHREAHARAQPGITHATFCGVVRPADHPLRPKDYVPLDAFWTKRGYRSVDGLIGSFDWLDIGDTAETTKPMQFWLRALS